MPLLHRERVRRRLVVERRADRTHGPGGVVARPRPSPRSGSCSRSEHPGVTFRWTFTGTDTLAAQIEQGAPADVFAGASTTYGDELSGKGLIEAPKNFATNRLVLIVPPANPAHISSPKDLTTPGLKLVVARPDGARRRLHEKGAREPRRHVRQRLRREGARERRRQRGRRGRRPAEGTARGGRRGVRLRHRRGRRGRRRHDDHAARRGAGGGDLPDRGGQVVARTRRWRGSSSPSCCRRRRRRCCAERSSGRRPSC